MAKKSGSKKIRQKSLTLNDLVKHNQEVLFPALDDKFVKIDDKFIKVNKRFNKIDVRFDKVDKEIDEKFNKIMDGQDKILGEIEKMRSENIAGIELYKKQEEKIENHEIRIKIVEQKASIVAVKGAR